MRYSEFKQTGSIGAFFLFIIILGSVLGLFLYNSDSMIKIANSPERQTAELNAENAFFNSPFRFDSCGAPSGKYAICYGSNNTQQVSIQCRTDVVLETQGCRKTK